MLKSPYTSIARCSAQDEDSQAPVTGGLDYLVQDGNVVSQA
jgi:hypothetical protein